MRFNEQPIVNSLLDIDLNKLTMMQLVVHHFLDVKTEYKFICRNKRVDLTPYIDEIRKEVAALEHLEFRLNELNFLKKIPFFKPKFIEFLRDFKFNIDDVKIEIIENKGKKELSIKTNGFWWQNILYETYILSIVNEIYFREQIKKLTKREKSDLFEDGRRRLGLKINKIKNRDDFKFSEMGTRRRFGREWQMEIVHYLKSEASSQLQGTSNLYLAYEFNLKAMGTMAHDYLQAFQSLSNKIENSQIDAMKYWILEYEDDLGVMLTDVITMDDFLIDFNLDFSNKFSGIRHDSGDPFIWAEKAISHYEKLGIDPKTKKLVFSDNLDFDKAIQIFDKYHKKTMISFGIGTNLTNDLGLEKIDTVMKMVKCNGKSVAKISDSHLKSGDFDQLYLKKLNEIFKNKKKCKQ
jgi:nicotinate phosphoribosyltransferase